MDDISLGVLLPVGQAQWGGADPRELVDFAVRAEDLGYSSLWVNDSLLTPRIEALTMLAVGAAFPGRFGEPQHALSGVPWERRFRRLDETVALWRQLWTEPGPSSFEGELLRYPELPAMTRPFQSGGPPVWLGGGSDSARRRTGRLYDGWLPYPPSAGEYRDGLAAVRAAAAEAGRPAGAVEPGLFVSVAVTGSVAGGRRLLAEYSQANYGMPVEQLETIQALAAGPPSYVAERLGAYVAAGARHLAVRIAAGSLAAQREQLEELIKLKPLLTAG
jgi:alkanesulfonate monooxygenase SsuD/methylene tetrahydromethanopterin reductase-like flavin-dependent oxidoreductase (luciferase family)